MWSELDRAKALAYLIEERLKCSTCGTREEEWDYKRNGGDRSPYVPVLVTCEGCSRTEAAMDDAYKSAHKQGKKVFGLRVKLMPKAAYRDMIAARRKDPSFVQAEKERRGVTAQSEKKKRRREAAEARKAEKEQPKGMFPADESEEPNR